MPVPIIKMAFTTIRLFNRPFVTVMTRRIRDKPSEAERNFFRWFGIRCYAFENYVEQKTCDNKSGVKKVPRDLDNISEGAALNKGVEYFCELVFFYGFLLSLTAYELRKSWNDTCNKDCQLDRLE